MEHHSKRNVTRVVNDKDSALHLPYIEKLIEEGTITVGVISPAGSVAVANEGRNTLAMLRRRKGESLTQLLVRLDLAIGKAFTDDVFTDEVNA